MAENVTVRQMERHSIEGCARCGENHTDVLFKRMYRPVQIESSYAGLLLLTHFAPCPNNGDPILLMITENVLDPVASYGVPE